MAGERGAEETAREPTTGIVNGCSPVSCAEKSADGQNELIPAAVNPGSESDQENGQGQMEWTGFALSEPRPHEDEQQKDGDGDQKRAAQVQAADHAGHADSGEEDCGQPCFRTAQPGQDSQADEHAQASD